MFKKLIKLILFKKVARSKEYRIGGLVPQIHALKKGERYIFVVSCDGQLTNHEREHQIRQLEAANKAIMENLGIISMIFLLDYNMKLNVI